MDYIYSSLNKELAMAEYTGGETETAIVVINNIDRSITVDVKKLSPSMLDVIQPTSANKYILQETVSEGNPPTYEWVLMDSYNEEIQSQIQALQNNLNEEINNREQSESIINNSITGIQSNISELSSNLSNESSRINEIEANISAINEDLNSISSQINSNSDRIDDNANSISENSSKIEENLESIKFNNQLILNESEIRASSFNSLQKQIDDEESSRAQRDDQIQEQLNNEENVRSQEDENLQEQITSEQKSREEVDQHLWDILPDNIIAGTPMQGMENANAINIVFSKYQKHGIEEDPADAELVEVPNQAITLFPATQEVAGVLTAADKTKIDNIATDIETAVQAEAEARQDADTAIEDKLDSLIVVEGDAIQVGREDKELNIKTGGRFTVNSNYEVVTSEEYPGEPGRRIIPLENNDQIAGKKTDGDGVPLIFVSKWNKVEVGGSGAPINLNSDDGKVTVNDTYTLLDNTDKESIDTSIDGLSTRIENLEGKTTRLFYDGEVNPPSASDINTWITGLEAKPPYTEPFSGITVVVHMTDENTYHSWHYYENLESWKDDGIDTVSTFTNESSGIIKGSTKSGYIGASEDGTGFVNGWDTKTTAEDVNSIISSATIKTSQLYNDGSEILILYTGTSTEVV